MRAAPESRPGSPAPVARGLGHAIPLLASVALHGVLVLALAVAQDTVPPQPLDVSPTVIAVMLAPAGVQADAAPPASRAGRDVKTAEAVPESLPEPEPVTARVPEPEPDAVASSVVAVMPPAVKPRAPARPVRPRPVRPARVATPDPAHPVRTAASPGGRTHGAIGDAVAGARGGSGSGSTRAPGYVLGSARNPAPPYPEQARRRGHEGTVLLTARVSAEGRVLGVSVARSSGHGSLDRAARRAVRGWRFQPATRAGVPVSGTARVTIRFVLR
ncbi:energy transducer TonB [Roseospira visakhapatnamensis]|uniref:Protein TonB n=1 Tax=Roseospira visakhapatnamensis TaxID=390880 RepID=A0A7W6REE6_9PROT|nr:energy transducer TonB [Roseospira visakhapatnamensis]MBB4266504.1 protein TonB [Roseospira visakhapatnamensis]